MPSSGRHVTMLTEGTSPHIHGGVSTWCDHLIRGMPEVDFQVLALTGSGREPVVRELSPHLFRHRVLPLWGPAEPRGLPPLPGRERCRYGARRWNGVAPRLTACPPYALFGLGTGGLVLYAAVGDLLAAGRAPAGTEATALGLTTAAALTLSMGPAEWLPHRFRRAGPAGLRAATTPGAFARSTTAALAACLGGYLAVLALLGVLGAQLAPDTAGSTGPRLTALLLLGTVLWTALLLQSFGSVLPAALFCLAAAGAQTAALATGTGDPLTTGPHTTGPAALLLVLLGCALLGRATAHRR